MPATQPGLMTAGQLRSVSPFFLVSDLGRSAAYYRDVLGFSYDQFWGVPPSFCMVKRDGVVIMLKQAREAGHVHPNTPRQAAGRSVDLYDTGDEAGGGGGAHVCWDVHIVCRDAEGLFAEFTSRGAVVAYKPLDRPLYGMREFAVQDPDGHVLAFGQDVGGA